MNNPRSYLEVLSSSPRAIQKVSNEIPAHNNYLKAFRVEQCSLFLQLKCTRHRPYTCFFWHFTNQRRRVPILRKDGTFNYDPDTYCDKYDEKSGVCPNSDGCPFVHRNTGNTEKRHHLRYYKTVTCVHDTHIVNCPFAHGATDIRPPIYDIRELKLQRQGKLKINPSSLSSDREIATPNKAPNNEFINEKDGFLNEDLKWNNTNYVLTYYKTEQCRRPPRLCRKGLACPQYHNARDKRRNPSIFKYRSTPCPNVKQGDDWLEPTACEKADQCEYCHSCNEQKFHRKIYKSSKCNDIITTGYCPREPFCAFFHIKQELKNLTTNLNNFAMIRSQNDDYGSDQNESNHKLNGLVNSLLQQQRAKHSLQEPENQRIIEKLKQDFLMQTEVSNKFETICLQYKQLVEKLANDVNEWKNGYIALIARIGYISKL